MVLALDIGASLPGAGLVLGQLDGVAPLGVSGGEGVHVVVKGVVGEDLNAGERLALLVLHHAGHRVGGGLGRVARGARALALALALGRTRARGGLVVVDAHLEVDLLGRRAHLGLALPVLGVHPQPVAIRDLVVAVHILPGEHRVAPGRTPSIR
jgi:hypothetical protein